MRTTRPKIIKEIPTKLVRDNSIILINYFLYSYTKNSDKFNVRIVKHNNFKIQY